MLCKEKDKISLVLTDLMHGTCVPRKWSGSALNDESTLHQISPYIGKMKSSMAAELIETFSRPDDFVYDPFCGAGTIVFQAWAAGRNVLATDLNPYAGLLTHAKLFPPSTMETALHELENAAAEVRHFISHTNLETVPDWVKNFFHPQTLQEILAWIAVLKQNHNNFLLACLMGILHHQRPGFLSYPSSHTVPYLRYKKFPREDYPQLYEYRPVKERLEKKVKRALKRTPILDFGLFREYTLQDALTFKPIQKIHTIITSPPYMRQLDYGRDNRLRLWFLGVDNWKTLDDKISPPEIHFIHLMKSCLKRWQELLVPGGHCVFVLGDTYSRTYKLSIPDMIAQFANEEIQGYSLEWQYKEEIPQARRVRRNYAGSTTETVLVLKKNSRK